MYAPPALAAAPIAPRSILRKTKRPTRGQTVIVLPGFMACDLSTSVLRCYLGRLGYRTLPWNMGRNLGPVDGLVEQLIDRVRTEAADTGGSVSLIGHSLGGIFAREVARAAPSAVRLVITLGSPIRALSPDGVVFTNPAMVRLIERSVGKSVGALRREGAFDDLTAPPPVRCVALFSRRDRIAHWESCLETPSRLTENVEVHTSHRRMVFSPGVFRVIADRLDRHMPSNAATPLKKVREPLPLPA